MDAATRELVRQRAGQRCEYCRLPEALDALPFHIDHIVARVHGGGDEANNLSWACTQCNLHKGTSFASIDPDSKARVDLFNPRADTWHDHFAVRPDGRLEGLTPAGRATVRLLDMNGLPQLDLRRELIQQGEYPAN
jgi:HNH endonuclease